MSHIQFVYGASYRQTPIVLRAAHAQIFGQAFDLRVADVAAVEEGEEVEQGEHGD